MKPPDLYFRAALTNFEEQQKTATLIRKLSFTMTFHTLLILIQKLLEKQEKFMFTKLQIQNTGKKGWLD